MVQNVAIVNPYTLLQSQMYSLDNIWFPSLKENMSSFNKSVMSLTTDGINFSARSANDSGVFFALAKMQKLNTKKATNIIFIFFILIFN